MKGNLDFNDRRTTVEHLDPKDADARNNTFRYDNLVALCSGGEVVHRKTKPRITYCNSKRGNGPIAFKPTDENCEERVYYSVEGEIFGETEEIENTLHAILGLDNFNIERKAEIRSYYYENLEEHNSWDGIEEGRPPLIIISSKDARKIITKLSNKDADGKYQEFCSAVIYILKNDILQS